MPYSRTGGAQSSSDDSGSDSDDECPLCMEPYEADDKMFYPCSCGYQVCRFCWHKIRSEENGLCPACRKEYSDTPAEYTPMSVKDVQLQKEKKKAKKAQKKAKEIDLRKSLVNVRVVQKNLVYVIGLPHRVGYEETMLRKHEYFGQYGKITKIVVNKNNHYNSGPNPTVSAYITFGRNEDASACVRAIDKSTLDGRVLRASFGTTKYCSRFLLDLPCLNPDCMYLHELGDEAVSYTKQDMLEGKHAADVSVIGAGKPLRGFGNKELEGNGGMDEIEQITAYIPGGQQPPPSPGAGVGPPGAPGNGVGGQNSGPAPSFSDENMFPSAALVREGSGGSGPGGGMSPTLNGPLSGSWGSGGGGGGGVPQGGRHGMAPPGMVSLQQQQQQQQQQLQQRKGPPGMGAHVRQQYGSSGAPSHGGGMAQNAIDPEAKRIQEMLARSRPPGGGPPMGGPPMQARGAPPGAGGSSSAGPGQRAGSGPPPGVYDPRYNNQGGSGVGGVGSAPMSAAQAQARSQQQQLQHQQQQHHRHNQQQQQQQQQQRQQPFGSGLQGGGQFGGVGNSLFNSSQPNPGQDLLSQLHSSGGSGAGGRHQGSPSGFGGGGNGTGPMGGGQRRGEPQPDVGFDPWAEMTRGLTIDVSGDVDAVARQGGGSSGSAGGSSGFQPEVNAGASASASSGQTTGRARKSRFAFAQSSDQPTDANPASGGDVPAVGSSATAGNKADEWQDRMRMLFPGVNISVGDGPADTNGGNQSNLNRGGRGGGGQQRGRGGQMGGYGAPLHPGQQQQQGSGLLNTLPPFGNEASGGGGGGGGGGFPLRNQQQQQQQQQRNGLIDPAIVSTRGFGALDGGGGSYGGGSNVPGQQPGTQTQAPTQTQTQTQPLHAGWDSSAAQQQQSQSRMRGNTGMPGRAR